MGRGKDGTKKHFEEVRLLKKRIKSLERENAALRKGIKSGRALPIPEPIDPVETEPIEEIHDKIPDDVIKCRCGKQARKVKLSKRGVEIDYAFCSSCGRREPIAK